MFMRFGSFESRRLNGPAEADTDSRGPARRSFLVLTAVGVAGSAGLVGCSGSSHPASADIAITACQTDPAGHQPTADGTVVNHTNKTSSYEFDLIFNGAAANNFVTHKVVTLPSVASGETATWHAIGIANATGDLKCRVTAIKRRAV